MLFLNISPVIAQSGFTLSWDSEVGCLNYSEDRKNNVPLEDITDDDCLLVCEGTEVKFKLNYDQQEQNVESIDWQPEHGNLQGTGNNDTSAEIFWPNATNDAGVTVHILLEDGEEIYSTICVKVKQKPDAKFIVDNNVNRFFCSHIDIDFENVSQAADGFQIVANHWDFGDGSSSNAGNPLIFIPNSGFTGGFSQVDIRATANINGKREVICHEVYNLTFPNLSGNQNTQVEMSVNPNPAEITAEVRYKVDTPAGFDQGKMVLYNLSGALIETRTIKDSKGEVNFDLSRLASGNYILVFYHHNVRIGQQIIVKK